MKKIITLLFILVFTGTSFATRILTIRNSSNYERGFYALEMVIHDPDLIPGPYLHAATERYIRLKPGEFITFSNFDPVNINDFNYCPTATSEYELLPNVGFDGSNNIFKWIYDEYEPPVAGQQLTRISRKIIECHQVPQLPTAYGPRAIFRGFKIDDHRISSYGITDYFIPKNQDWLHTYSNHPGYSGDYHIKETFVQLPLNNPTLEIQEIIFL